MLSLSSDLEKGKLIASPRSRRELIFDGKKRMNRRGTIGTL